jgi:hypothetical protein
MRFLLLFATLAAAAVHAQDAWREAGTYAAIPLAAPSTLAKGSVNCARVPIAGSALNLSTESNYLLPVSPDRAVRFIHQPTNSAAETDRRLAKPAIPANFAKLSVTDSSLKTVRNLDLSTSEKNQIRNAVQAGSADQINAAWRALLLNRATAYQTGGLNQATPEAADSGAFRPVPELVGLLKQRTPMLRRFVGLMDEIITGRPGKNQPVSYYWTDEKIQGNQNLSLGALHTLATATGYQLADLTYYSATSYFLSLTLYELWPVTVSGRTQTYVWRGDYVISPSIGHARGIERMAAENIMVLEVKAAIRDQLARCQAHLADDEKFSLMD